MSIRFVPLLQTKETILKTLIMPGLKNNHNTKQWVMFWAHSSHILWDFKGEGVPPPLPQVQRGLCPLTCHGIFVVSGPWKPNPLGSRGSELHADTILMSVDDASVQREVAKLTKNEQVYSPVDLLLKLSVVCQCMRGRDGVMKDAQWGVKGGGGGVWLVWVDKQ